MTAPNGAASWQAVVDAARPLRLRVWAPPLCVATLTVISALSMGGFWLRSAVVIGVGSLVLLAAVAWRGRMDRATALVVAFAVALAAWWALRAATTAEPLSFFPFGVSVVVFAGAFAAVRPLTSKQRQAVAVVVASVGAFEALTGFYGITVRSSPLAIADQGLWRLASTVTYSNAAGLILAMSLLVALGLNERWRYSRGLVCLCVAGLLATQSRGALVAVACGLLFVPRARFTATWLPIALGAIAAVVAVATSASSGAEPIVGVVLVACIGASAVLPSAPVVPAMRRHATLGVIGGAVVAVTGVGVLHGELQRRLFTSASLFDRNPEWSSAYHQFLHAPWFGVGPDRLIPLLGSQGSFAYYAHNEYLQVADDAGVIGLLLLVLVAVAVAKTVRRTDVATSCACGALVTFAVSGVVDFNWHLPITALLAGVAAAMAGRASPQASGQGDDVPAPQTTDAHHKEPLTPTRTSAAQVHTEATVRR